LDSLGSAPVKRRVKKVRMMDDDSSHRQKRGELKSIDKVKVTQDLNKFIVRRMRNRAASNDSSLHNVTSPTKIKD
jgi:hypothetical protein